MDTLLSVKGAFVQNITKKAMLTIGSQNLNTKN